MLRGLFATTTFAAMAAIAGCTSVLGISDDPKTQPATTNNTPTPDGGGTVNPADAKCEGSLYVRIATDFSGTATDIAIPHFWGLYDRLRKINEGGGIRGCKIDMDVQDNQYTPAQTSAVVDKWRTSDPNWSKVNTLFIFGTGPTTAAGPKLMEEKKVIIPGSYAGAFASPKPIEKTVTYPIVNATFQEAQTNETKKSAGWPYVFYPATDYGTGIRLGIQAAWTVAPGRMAFAHDTADKCAYCVEPLAAGMSFVSSLQGMSIGRDLIIPQTSAPTDEPKIKAAVTDYFTAEIAQFKTANASSYAYEPVSWVWTGNSVYASAILGKYVAQVQAQIDADTAIQALLTKYNKKWKLRVMANNWGIGETTAGTCGDECKNDNFYGLFPVPRFADLQNASAMAELIANRDNWATKDQTNPPPAPITARKPDAYRDVRYVQGYAAAAMWELAVTKAIEAGSKNPTGEEIKTALEKFNSQDMGGLTAGPITFTPDDHRPQTNENIYKLDGNGTLTFVNRFSLQVIPEWLGY